MRIAEPVTGIPANPSSPDRTKNKGQQLHVSKSLFTPRIPPPIKGHYSLITPDPVLMSHVHV